MGLHLRIQQPIAGMMIFCSEVFGYILIEPVGAERRPISRYDEGPPWDELETKALHDCFSSFATSGGEGN